MVVHSLCSAPARPTMHDQREPTSQCTPCLHPKQPTRNRGQRLTGGLFCPHVEHRRTRAWRRCCLKSGARSQLPRRWRPCSRCRAASCCPSVSATALLSEFQGCHIPSSFTLCTLSSLHLPWPPARKRPGLCPISSSIFMMQEMARPPHVSLPLPRPLQLGGLGAVEQRQLAVRLAAARSAAVRSPRADHYKLLGLTRSCSADEVGTFTLVLAVLAAQAHAVTTVWRFVLMWSLTHGQVRKAYKKFALRMHPDKALMACRFACGLTPGVLLVADEPALQVIP